MSGNVDEMCWDKYGNYPVTDQTDYKGMGNRSCQFRMTMGSSWKTIFLNYMQIGNRGISCTFYESEYSGFRIARSH